MTDLDLQVIREDEKTRIEDALKSNGLVGEPCEDKAQALKTLERVLATMGLRLDEDIRFEFRSNRNVPLARIEGNVEITNRLLKVRMYSEYETYTTQRFSAELT